uniref:Type-5 uracil-DNA glycosylase n=1 Tax=uncultured bacterium AOCefta2 TaxID=654977 RepID=D6MLV7_9BACT|nr:uracil-DNA glycosylase superfamily [uncultured bacterium AOCefta2]
MGSTSWDCILTYPSPRQQLPHIAQTNGVATGFVIGMESDMEKKPIHSAEGCISGQLSEIGSRIVDCRLCPRLVEWREKVAREKTRRFRDCEYWGRPVPSFGVATARMLVIGLAPAAHGGNRTGRIFTGDRSGDWLFRALHKAGFANQPQSVSVDDGLALKDCFIAATARCAPPDNTPLPVELENCRPYLTAEADLLWPQLKAVVPLGGIAFAWWLNYLKGRGLNLGRPLPRFAHLAEFAFENAPSVLCSFHPSQQNTQTGRLTEPMFDAVWTRAKGIIAG